MWISVWYHSFNTFLRKGIDPFLVMSKQSGIMGGCAAWMSLYILKSNDLRYEKWQGGMSAAFCLTPRAIFGSLYEICRNGKLRLQFS